MNSVVDQIDDVFVPLAPGMPPYTRFVPRSDAYRVANFAVPKNACTTFKEVLYTLSCGEPFGERCLASGRKLTVHNVFASLQFDVRRVSAFSNYFTFVILRDPVARLVSCYRNRVQHYRELSEKHLGRPHSGPNDLRPDPTFREFVDRLEDYRLASRSIKHHSDPHSFFLGTDLSVYTEVVAFPKFELLGKRLSDIAGRPIEIPHTQTGGGIVAAEDLDLDVLAQIRRFYAADYHLIGSWLT